MVKERIYNEKSREYARNYYKDNKDYFKLYWKEKHLLLKISDGLEAIREKKKLEKLDKKLMNKKIDKFKKIEGKFILHFD